MFCQVLNSLLAFAVEPHNMQGKIYLKLFWRVLQTAKKRAGTLLFPTSHKKNSKTVTLIISGGIAP